MIRKYLGRFFYIVMVIVIGLLAALFLLISPIAEYLIEKYSPEYTGRLIQMDNLKINLLNGSVKADNLMVYEPDSKNRFISVSSLYVNSNLYSFVSGENHITDVTLTHPVINLLQTGDTFNFDDLMVRFLTSDTTTAEAEGEPVKYLLENLIIEDGEVNYLATPPGATINLENINVRCRRIAWNDPVIALESTLGLKSGGKADAGFAYNLESADYTLNLRLDMLDITLLYPYLRDYLFVQSLNGLFSTHLNLTGNAERTADIAASGYFTLDSFSLVDTTGEQLASAGSIRIEVDTINSANDTYYFNRILVDRPYVLFAMYDNGYNFDRLMTAGTTTDTVTGEASVEDYANIFRMMADYIAYFTREYKISNYKADSFILTNGAIEYTDYTLEDKFLYRLDSLHLNSGNLNSASERMNISLDARMNTSGKMHGTLSVDPDGFSEMDISYSVRELLISDVNPYSIFYVATPFIDGRMYFENVTHIKNQQLTSENTLRIEQIEVGKKVKSKQAMNLPVKLAVSLLTDLNGNINLSIPVVGDLNDPTYKWGRALLQVLKNIVIKAAVAPYRLIANAFGGDEEQYRQIRMTFLKADLPQGEKEKLENLVNVLTKKPGLRLTFTQESSEIHETEMLALFKAKKAFLGYPQGEGTGSDDIYRINAVSNRDSLFNVWLNNRAGRIDELVSVQQKAIGLFGKENLRKEVALICQQRSDALKAYFVSKGITPERIAIRPEITINEQTSQTGPQFVISYGIDGESSDETDQYQNPLKPSE